MANEREYRQKNLRARELESVEEGEEDKEIDESDDYDSAYCHSERTPPEQVERRPSDVTIIQSTQQVSRSISTNMQNQPVKPNEKTSYRGAFCNVIMDFIKGIIAGAFISVGGFLFVILTAVMNEGENEYYGRLAGSSAFSVGLILVCVLKMSLYTGKIGKVFEELQPSYFYVGLLTMLIGNIIGATGCGYLCHWLTDYKNIFPNSWLERVIIVSVSRMMLHETIDYVKCSVQSIMCGFCVYGAVHQYLVSCGNKWYDGLPRGALCIIIFVFLFVYASFEHCIANVFYFSFANAWIRDFKSFLNILICIVGNSIGSLLGVIVLYKSKDSNMNKGL